MHVDDAEASSSLLTGHGNGVGISDQPDVKEIVGLTNR